MNFFITREDPTIKTEVEEDDVSLLTLNNDDDNNNNNQNDENNNENNNDQNDENNNVSEKLSMTDIPRNQDVLFFSVSVSFQFSIPAGVKV